VKADPHQSNRCWVQVFRFTLSAILRLESAHEDPWMPAKCSDDQTLVWFAARRNASVRQRLGRRMLWGLLGSLHAVKGYPTAPARYDLDALTH
jgi:hypothetical protein